ncbi:hypothetical protein [Pseudalkalibacillus caeni]|uniref:Uncharacterized protein n=1 Tax=Exobacillus caeni TaxID=2574798 RepID=A0A5R9EXA5_9BACL|nr:hypothetical protein [Pseudalkalibacillus caeni]TLS35902.1 hypothetical protein FCL54_18075 [Pseudalkalibacillus caeni]
MEYIMENATIFPGQGEKKKLVIKDGKVEFITGSVRLKRRIACNMERFVMAPGKIMMDRSLLQLENEAFKERLKSYQKIGCTTLLVICNVTKERKLPEEINNALDKMKNSSLDFVIGVSVPMIKVTPGLVQQCNKHLIPYIIAEPETEKDLQTVPWEWVQQKIFPYNAVIAPDLHKLHLPERKRILLEKQWKEISGRLTIPTNTTIPEMNEQIDFSLLKQIGIFPQKGRILSKSDLDYNLFPLIESMAFEEDEKVIYHKREPVYSVLRGQVMKSGEITYERPEFGQRLVIKRPGFFSTINKAY